MAEHADPTRVTKIRSGARAVYPWPTWTDGKWWRLREGDDYAIETQNFQRVARNYARRNGFKLETQLTSDGTFVRFTRKTS
jgi:hypothetical protein